MARFTQYTQAAQCPCFGRGYTIDGQGDFAPCAYCPAGEAFEVELAAIKAEHAGEVATPEMAPAIAPAAAETPDLAPVIAGPARVVPSLVVRHSERVAGLVLERRAYELTFRVGPAFLTYDVTGGRLRLVAGQDGGYLRPVERQHIKATARAYACKVA